MTETHHKAVCVAALYVDPDGVYAGLEGVDLWDEARDARLYAGPWPVVAHPPCERWCRFAKGIETQYPHYRVGDDGGCFEAALKAVERWGGVLEHPAGSLAWDAYGLPKPVSSGGWTFSLTHDGASCYVEQGRYGHPMRKATWLYVYGFNGFLPGLNWGRRIDAERGAFKWGSRLYQAEAGSRAPAGRRAALSHAAGVPRRAARDGPIGLTGGRSVTTHDKACGASGFDCRYGVFDADASAPSLPNEVGVDVVQRLFVAEDHRLHIDAPNVAALDAPRWIRRRHANA
jgi:hypothetical protein